MAIKLRKPIKINPIDVAEKVAVGFVCLLIKKRKSIYFRLYY